MTAALSLLLIGLLASTVGTMIGAGGGFMLVPILLLLRPELDAEAIAGISLAVIFVNALSGSIAYGRMKRIHYPSGFSFAAGAIPGAAAGAITTAFIPRGTFDAIFAFLLMALSGYLIAGGRKGNEAANEAGLSYNVRLGVSLSTVVGFMSSLLGIGGGIIHVPILTKVLSFPVHIATATSHFVLCITAFTATLVHVFNGTLSGHYPMIFWLGLGALAGGQFGAFVSNRLKARWILTALAVALFAVGLRILVRLV